MGRRKTRKVIKREPKRLPKVFRCPRCGEQSVVVDLDRHMGQGRIKCGRCQLSAEIPIHTLTQTIDVYAKFLDLYYEGKIVERPREVTEKPSEPVSPPIPTETQEVTTPPETATAKGTGNAETSQPATSGNQPPPPKPTQQTGQSQQTG